MRVDVVDELGKGIGLSSGIDGIVVDVWLLEGIFFLIKRWNLSRIEIGELFVPELLKIIIFYY